MSISLAVKKMFEGDQVESFRYNQTGKEKLIKLASKQKCNN